MLHKWNEKWEKLQICDCNGRRDLFVEIIFEKLGWKNKNLEFVKIWSSTETILRKFSGRISRDFPRQKNISRSIWRCFSKFTERLAQREATGRTFLEK